MSVKLKYKAGKIKGGGAQERVLRRGCSGEGAREGVLGKGC